MKKMLLKCLSALTLIAATSSAFAMPAYTTSVLPTSEALASHVKKAVKGANSIFTDIVIVNYTNTDIVLAQPDPARLITQRTSGRILSNDPSFIPYVQITTPDGRQIWPVPGKPDFIGLFDTFSVYISNGQYVVYDTPN